MRPSILLLAGLALCAACRAAPPGPPPAAPRLVRELSTPAAPGSLGANLAAAGGGALYLSWVEPAGTGHRLLLARRPPGGEWAAPRRVAEGTGWFVNWADFPSLAVDGGGALFAHWLERKQPGGHAYGVRLSVSKDGGANWSAPVVPHRAGTGEEHGFVSLVPRTEGGMDVVWLDGPEAGAMRLMATTLDAEARLGPEATLDDRVCDCCQTSAARTEDGLLVAYRDRTASEVRDISLLRTAAGGWTQPRPVAADGWRIDGCPVNGPALDGRGRTAVVAWFAAPSDEPRVQAAFTADGGATFGAPLRIDGGRPVGRVDVALLEDGDALVSWLETVGERAELRLRRVRADGRLGPPLVVAASSGARATGFPRLERAGSEVVVAWRDAAEPPRVRTALIAP